MSMIHCIYASTASRAYRPQELTDMLNDARARNLARGVSGILLYIDGNFFQVLEGEASVVDALYARIARDERHTRVTTIMREPIARRAFADWSMGFAELGPSELGETLGLNDFFDSGSCLATLTPGRAKKLLTAFAAGRWRHAAPPTRDLKVANAR
ncbi:MAG: BLUF domain-containing protein [Proteobacteria bacterium]|nr:BLUF domain-containing protein [Pseudomonadota bacterium]